MLSTLAQVSLVKNMNLSSLIGALLANDLDSLSGIFHAFLPPSSATCTVRINYPSMKCYYASVVYCCFVALGPYMCIRKTPQIKDAWTYQSVFR